MSQLNLGSFVEATFFIYLEAITHLEKILKIENVEPAFEPPHVETMGAEQRGNSIQINGKLIKKGDADQILVGFEYRPYAGFAESLHSDVWDATDRTDHGDSNTFKHTFNDVMIQGLTYEYRAVVEVNGIKLHGQVKRIQVK